jgi:acylphosphatase
MKHVRQVLIRGRVQGVGFRMWTEEEALDRGLVGWVRNRRDGSVEALFAGPAEAVADMIEACRQGPPGARVEAVDEQAAGEDALRLGYPEQRFSVLSTV